MLTVALLLAGAVLLALTLAERGMRRLPLTPALIYLVVGWLAGFVVGGRDPGWIVGHAALLTIGTELAVLVSLFAVGLRLRLMPTLAAWRQALLLAGPAMLLTIVLGTAAGVFALGLSWGAAWLLAAVLAPTDPVLASEVQIRSDHDRDVVRLSLTAEGGLNDGSALPAVTAGLGFVGLQSLQGDPEGFWGAYGGWWWDGLVWPVAGGALIGAALGRAIGELLRWRVQRGDPLLRDELLYAGGVALSYGIARATGTSAFVVAFIAAVTLLLPLARLPAPPRRTGPDDAPPAQARGGADLADRLHSVGASGERLVEAGAVLAVGVLLHGVPVGAAELGFAALMLVLVRPVSAAAVLWRDPLSPHQRRLVAWFGIRGVGTLFYLAYALEHGVSGPLASQFAGAALVVIAGSIVLHGVSATPLMLAYQRRSG